MAVMLRTQGIASRVVSGFQMGAYNDAADAYIVRQQDAHSWVEVYFPETDSWVTFDPTPVDGRPSSAQSSASQSSWQKYAEALDLLWTQYVVAYDRQEQRTLANSLRGTLGAYQQAITKSAGDLKAMLSAMWSGTPQAPKAGDTSRRLLLLARLRTAAIAAIVLVLLILFIRRVRRSGFRLVRKSAGSPASASSAVAFYERMAKALEARGLRRAAYQTPLEFALTTGVPEALVITQAYNSVRYGARHLSPAEAAEIEQTLRRMEESTRIAKGQA